MRPLGRLEHLKFAFLLHRVELALLPLVPDVVQVVEEALGLKLGRWVLHALMSAHGLVEVEEDACCRLMLRLATAITAFQSILQSIFRLPRVRQFHLGCGLGRHHARWKDNRTANAIPVLCQL